MRQHTDSSAQGPGPFTEADAAIWHTLAINGDLDAGALGNRPSLPSYIRLEHGEKLLAQGPFHLMEHRAVGDGSYAHNSSMFYASGAAGHAATVAFAMGRASGNAKRRAQAAADAVPRWVPLGSGTASVTTHRVWFEEPSRLYAWPWEAMTSTRLMAPHQLQFSGNTERGEPVSWILDSDWAELCFTLWARAVYPQHPQFLDHAWIPPGFVERARAAGYDPPPISR